METQNKFKMTFKNSWWQCLVALFVGAIIISIFNGIGNQDIQSAGAIVALIFAVWFARYLSRKTWEKKQKSIKGN